MLNIACIQISTFNLGISYVLEFESAVHVAVECVIYLTETEMFDVGIELKAVQNSV